MKIAIIGSHGTGKTHLSKYISKKFNLNHIPEIARLFDIMHNTHRKEIQFTMLNTQMLIESYNNNFVSDRCIVDYFVYYELLSKQKSILMEKMKLQLRTLTKNRYDLIIYIPILFKLVDDGYRYINPEFQKITDEKFKEYIKLISNSVKVFEIKQIDFNNRKIEVNNIINSIYVQ